MTDIAAVFNRYRSSRASTALQHEVANLARDGALDRRQLDGAIERVGRSGSSDPREDFLDLFFYYVRLAVADHDLSDEELSEIRKLKRLFRIEEGECLERRVEEVAELLGVEMRRILSDRQVDQAEALQKVRLQEAFGLGYDQFLELTRPYVEQAVAEIVAEASQTEGADVKWIEKRLLALDTVYDFESFLDKQVAGIIEEIEAAGKSYAASLLRERTRSRHISQEVKDQVWRRDQGRCVECGSQERLEFDHIIPFAKGGASTYRNVQLLCADCNRGKSDRIG